MTIMTKSNFVDVVCCNSNHKSWFRAGVLTVKTMVFALLIAVMVVTTMISSSTNTGVVAFRSNNNNNNNNLCPLLVSSSMSSIRRKAATSMRDRQYDHHCNRGSPNSKMRMLSQSPFEETALTILSTTTTTTTQPMIPPFDYDSLLIAMTGRGEDVATSATATAQTSVIQEIVFNNTDFLIFLAGIFPFVWATVEFWRRVMTGQSFGTGTDSIIIGIDDAPQDSRGRRILGKGALFTAYALFIIAFGTIGIVGYSVVTSAPPPPFELSSSLSSL